MRILVCGGRDFNYKKIFNILLTRELYHMDWNNILIIAGAAKGADTLAADFAKENGLQLIEFPAEWNKYGKRAGYIRNKQMLEEGKPNLVIAFPGGRGTKMMIDLAKKAGVEVIDFDGT